MKVLVSACLIGIPCRYDGRSNKIEALDTIDAQWVAVCPEVAGGLPTPRAPAEIVHDAVMTKEGRDVSAAFLHGAHYAVQLAREQDIRLALLKARSPSCGKDAVYDGTFSGTLVTGMGISARALLEAGLELYTEEELGYLDRALARCRQADPSA